MLRYRLKKGQEGFQVVDGPLAGRKFEKGKTYVDADFKGLATADQQRMEVVPEPVAEAAETSAKGGAKK